MGLTLPPFFCRFIQQVNLAAVTIQRWYRRHAQRHKAGAAALGRLLASRREVGPRGRGTNPAGCPRCDGHRSFPDPANLPARTRAGSAGGSAPRSGVGRVLAPFPAVPEGSGSPAVPPRPSGCRDVAAAAQILLNLPHPRPPRGQGGEPSLGWLHSSEVLAPWRAPWPRQLIVGLGASLFIQTTASAAAPACELLFLSPVPVVVSAPGARGESAEIPAGSLPAGGDGRGCSVWGASFPTFRPRAVAVGALTQP